MLSYLLYRNAWINDVAPHKELYLRKTEAKALLKRGGILVRNTYDFDLSEETDFWFVIKDHYKGLDELTPRVCNKVRHAFRFFNYKKMAVEQFESNVYPIQDDTIANYKVRDRKLNRKVFSEFLEKCKIKSFDYWGIFLKDTERMVGYCMVKKWEDSCEIWNVGILSEYKRDGYYPYYGLYHNLIEYYLKGNGIRYISEASRTITNHSEIHDWLIHYFHFRKAYCNLKLYYKWWFGIVVKVLYPFRAIIPNRSVKAVLEMHGMQTIRYFCK